MQAVAIDDYLAIFQARWAKLPVTDYLNLPLWYTLRTGVAMAAEVQAQEDQRAAARTPGVPRPNPGHKPAGVLPGLPRLGT